MGQNHRGSGDGRPQRGPGAEPRQEVLGRSPLEAEEFLKQLQANFTHFWQYFTHFHLYMPMFFRACRHHSTESAKWGAFDTVCPPLSASGGQLLPLPPALPPMQYRHRQQSSHGTTSSLVYQSNRCLLSVTIFKLSLEGSSETLMRSSRYLRQCRADIVSSSLRAHKLLSNY